MIGQYNYTVVLTYANLVFGTLGIFSALDNRIENSLIFLILAGICDMFDGMVARTKKNRSTYEKSYGIQIDSLADIVSFCVLPAITSFSIGNKGIISTSFHILFILAGLIRLAHFNVTELEISRTKQLRKYYSGLPVTSTAIIIPLFFTISLFANVTMKTIMLIGLPVTGILFVSKIKIPKVRIPKVKISAPKSISELEKAG
jgi:Phosphatidylserine synthase